MNSYSAEAGSTEKAQGRASPDAADHLRTDAWHDWPTRYNPAIPMNLRASRTTFQTFVFACLFTVAALGAKRPLTHADADSWNSGSSTTLSRDGHYLAYAIFPQEGDGQVVLRDLKTGTERREPAGAQPPPPAPDPESEVPPRAPSVTIAFSHDGKTLVFTTFPTKADTDAAKKAKKKPEEMPKGSLTIVPVAGGEAVRVAGVRNFQLPETGDGWLAYLKGAATGAGELVVRNLVTGAESSTVAVTEYTFAKDGKTLVYAAESGVYQLAPGAEAKAILAGKGKAQKLTWDKPQSRLAFLSDRDDTAAKTPKLKVYAWDRNAAEAVAVVESAPAGYVISGNGTAPLLFPKEGQRLFYSLGVPPIGPVSAGTTIPEDKASFDLWHYKDDYVQPIQKVKAAADRNRTFRAAYDFSTKTARQLADPRMADLTPSVNGEWALGGDDREYREENDYSDRTRDTYLVNTANGERHLVAKKHTGGVTWSPDGKYGMRFDGKEWQSISVPFGRVTNLTASINVRFRNEEHDSPSVPNPYGLGGWTKDGRALIYDRFDIWSVAPDGSGAVNLTQGAGRKDGIVLRTVRLDTEQETFDLTQPLLLKAENEKTREQGFYRLEKGSLRRLTMSAREYGTPIKAKDADVVVLTSGSFSEFPDLHVTDVSMKDFRKVSDVNPQKADLLWGSAELVHYVNQDGVKLDATLYKPENFDPAMKYPMIVYIYERLSQQLNRFVDPRPSNVINISYYVSNGYLVLTPDIAYTEGYPGQSALKCVLPAIQEVVKQGAVNENAIGIQGHSWGGYQIAYMVTQTNRFKAAAAGAPVANMTSAYDGIRWGTGLPRQFQYEKTQSRIGGSLWQYPMRFIENSPLFQADRIRTPLLMIHNDADDAVPWYQGIEMYLAMRRLGKEAYMFSYNGEPHNLRRRPNQKDYSMRMQQYFDYYLKGAPKPEWMTKGISYLEKQAELAGDGAK